MVSRIIMALGILAVAAPRAHSQVVNAFPNLPAFNFPTAIAAPVDATNRLYVVERAGRVYTFDNDPAVGARTLCLDISSKITTQTEGGMLDIAPYPHFRFLRPFYVTYTAESPRRTVLSRFETIPGNPNVADPASEVVILEIPKVNLHHNGGCVAFGPDGYLYLSLGDDGYTPNSQDLTVLTGKILRIDVDHPANGLAYGIPPDNPFAGNVDGYREEIWAYGFRNPWRFSFDAATNRLWAADVGEHSQEEIDVVEKGRNYGWPLMEGFACYNPPSCDTTGLDLALPVYAYDHGGSGASVTGGFVYRGPTQSGLFGTYLFSDYITGDTRALSWDGVTLPAVQTLDPVPNVASYGVDADGELYLASADGTIYRFDVPASAAAPSWPSRLVARPNPFGESASLSYDLAEPGHVRVDVYDVQGHRLRTLADGPRSSGAHSLAWDGRDAGGNDVPAGVYFVRLSNDGRVAAVARLVKIR